MKNGLELCDENKYYTGIVLLEGSVLTNLSCSKYFVQIKALFISKGENIGIYMPTVGTYVCDHHQGGHMLSHRRGAMWAYLIPAFTTPDDLASPRF